MVFQNFSVYFFSKKLKIKGFRQQKNIHSALNLGTSVLIFLA